MIWFNWFSHHKSLIYILILDCLSNHVFYQDNLILLIFGLLWFDYKSDFIVLDNYFIVLDIDFIVLDNDFIVLDNSIFEPEHSFNYFSKVINSIFRPTFAVITYNCFNYIIGFSNSCWFYSKSSIKADLQANLQADSCFIESCFNFENSFIRYFIWNLVNATSSLYFKAGITSSLKCYSNLLLG